MRKVSSIGLLLISALFVGACSSDGTLVSEAPIGGTEETGETGEVVPVLSDVSVIASSNVLQSDGALPVDITARVVDENNNAVPGITVEFSTDSGVLVVSQSATDAEGRAIASLSTEEDPTNRTISVTAEALSGDGLMLSSTVQVEVIGTELAPLSGPSSLVLGAQGTYTAVLLNANDNGIAGVPLTITSALGNTIALNNTATDVDGRVEFTLSAQVGGDDQITVSGLGISSTTGVSISSDSFAFITPAPLNNPNAVREIPLNTPQPLEVLWTTAGNEVVGQPIQFSTTRGVIMNTGQVLTDGNGIAGNSVMAADAGRATITASNPGGGPSTQLTFEFVATVPDTIEVQADPFNVGPNEQSAITAVVRDPAGNLVKNQIVIFELSDETGGVLTVGTAITDSQGRAQTFYQASASTSANEGVTVAATVQGSAVTDSVSITVARREVFFSFGTGNTLEEPTPASYSLPFIVQATDADGNGVAGVEIQLSVLSERWQKGYWVGDPIANRWFTVVNATCDDEDTNRNGVLDVGEDLNGNGLIDVGNTAVIRPGVATTDDTGQILAFIDYAQEVSTWLQVVVEAKTDVQGTEFSENSSFLLPVLSADVTSINIFPPGNTVVQDPANGYPNGDLGGLLLGPVSPFGYSLSCFDDL